MLQNYRYKVTLSTGSLWYLHTSFLSIFLIYAFDRVQVLTGACARIFFSLPCLFLPSVSCMHRLSCPVLKFVISSFSLVGRDCAQVRVNYQRLLGCLASVVFFPVTLASPLATTAKLRRHSEKQQDVLASWAGVIYFCIKCP